MSRKTRRRRGRHHIAPEPSTKNKYRAERRAEKKARKKGYHQNAEMHDNHEVEVIENPSASLFTTMRRWIDADYQSREPTKAIWI